MRIANGLIVAMLMLTGCMFHKSAPRAAAPPPATIQSQTPVIKPDLRTTGKVAMVNGEARFVVVSFPEGPVPQAQQHLNVYRQGAKVGELKVTGPQRGSDTVADIISGEAQVLDEVRAE